MSVEHNIEGVVIMDIDYKNSTPEDIIRALICHNGGTQSFLVKDEMIQLGEARGLVFENKSYKKEELYDILITVYTAEELQTLGHAGVSSYHWQKKFNITNYKLKKLVKMGHIQVTGKERFRVAGRYRYAALYSAYDFCRITTEDIERWLKGDK